jgi:hypothetical protein
MSATCPVGELTCPVGALTCSVGEMTCLVGELTCPVGEMTCPEGELECPEGELTCQVGELTGAVKSGPVPLGFRRGAKRPSSLAVPIQKREEPRYAPCYYRCPFLAVPCRSNRSSVDIS